MSEYFIGSDAQQGGISIRLREMILSKYRGDIVKYIRENDNSRLSVNAFLEEKIGKNFEEYGLTLEDQDKGGVR